MVRSLMLKRKPDLFPRLTTSVFGKVHRTLIINCSRDGNGNGSFRWASDGFPMGHISRAVHIMFGNRLIYPKEVTHINYHFNSEFCHKHKHNHMTPKV